MYNIENYNRIIAIGDIHGCYNTLLELLEQLAIDFNNDLVVFLGDYIDRGKFPLKTLLRVKDLVEIYPDNVIVLKGNHEDMFVRYMRNDDTCWTNNGFKSTIKDLKNNLNDTQINYYVEWCDKLPERLQIGKYKFCHSGQWEQFPMYKCGYSSNLWDRDWLYYYENYNLKDDELMIFGHTPVTDVYKCFNDKNEIVAIDIDTGAVFFKDFKDAKLTSVIIDLKSEKYEFVSKNTVEMDK